MVSLLKDQTILVTGGAGFIGSHLAQSLAPHNRVLVLDNLSTGRMRNVPQGVGFIHGDLRNLENFLPEFKNVEIVFHQAALPSVMRSIQDPVTTHEVNATGTLRLLELLRKTNAKKIVYASSSSAYGNSPQLPKQEDAAPNPLSPYAASKLMGEYYIRAYAHVYGFSSVSLRYFNVYGLRQASNSPYAAVIPRFFQSVIDRKPLVLYGDGKQTRDFTYVEDAVRANLLAARSSAHKGEVVNVAGGKRISLLELISILESLVGRKLSVRHDPPRPGDVRDSLADLTRARTLLGYEPQTPISDGLRKMWEAFANASGEEISST